MIIIWGTKNWGKSGDGLSDKHANWKYSYIMSFLYDTLQKKGYVKQNKTKLIQWTKDRTIQRQVKLLTVCKYTQLNWKNKKLLKVINLL